jgi:hypothetical protein
LIQQARGGGRLPDLEGCCQRCRQLDVALLGHGCRVLDPASQGVALVELGVQRRRENPCAEDRRQAAATDSLEPDQQPPAIDRTALGAQLAQRGAQILGPDLLG